MISKNPPELCASQIVCVCFFLEYVQHFLLHRFLIRGFVLKYLQRHNFNNFPKMYSFINIPRIFSNIPLKIFAKISSKISENSSRSASKIEHSSISPRNYQEILPKSSSEMLTKSWCSKSSSKYFLGSSSRNKFVRFSLEISSKFFPKFFFGESSWSSSKDFFPQICSRRLLTFIRRLK